MNGAYFFSWDWGLQETSRVVVGRGLCDRKWHLCHSYSKIMTAQLIVTLLLGDVLTGWSLLPKSLTLILHLDSLAIECSEEKSLKTSKVINYLKLTNYHSFRVLTR